jgi:hypothetical protein
LIVGADCRKAAKTKIRPPDARELAPVAEEDAF